MINNYTYQRYKWMLCDTATIRVYDRTILYTIIKLWPCPSRGLHRLVRLGQTNTFVFRDITITLKELLPPILLPLLSRVFCIAVHPS